MIKVIQLLFFFLSFLIVGAQNNRNQSVDWQSPQTVQSLFDNDKLPIIIDVYTDWCHYCKVMDNTTWKSSAVSKYIAENFYAIKFNAEAKDSLNWMGKPYGYKPSYKVHMLAVEWLKGNMVYPSTVIIPADGNEPIVIPGVITVKELEPILMYFGEKQYLTTTWEQYKATYKNSWN